VAEWIVKLPNSLDPYIQDYNQLLDLYIATKVLAILFYFMVIFAFGHILFFFRGMRSTGPLVVAVGRMFIDILKFIGLLIIVILGFSQFFTILEKDQDPRYQRFPLAIFASIQTSYQQIYFWRSNSGFSFLDAIGNTFMAIFVLLVQVSLINMLIAMQGNTYDDVTDSALEHWGASWATLVLHFEDSFWPPPFNILRFFYDIYNEIKKARASPHADGNNKELKDYMDIIRFHKKDEEANWPPGRGAELIAKKLALADKNDDNDENDDSKKGKFIRNSTNIKNPSVRPKVSDGGDYVKVSSREDD